jgi:hypothetical protein
MPVETRQPLINAQNMAYTTDTACRVENQWDHNAHADAEGLERHHINQIYDLEDGDVNVEIEGYLKESEAADHAAARRGMGPSRRRPFQNPEDRIQTAQTRKDKACLRCRMQKVRVLNPPFAVVLQVTNLATPVLSGPFKSKRNLFDLSESLEFESTAFALRSL